jgi:hypothetical protein
MVKDNKLLSVQELKACLLQNKLLLDNPTVWQRLKGLFIKRRIVLLPEFKMKYLYGKPVRAIVSFDINKTFFWIWKIRLSHQAELDPYSGELLHWRVI